MRVILDQIYGAQEKFDLQIVKPRLILEDSSESEALAQGWSICQGRWILSRLTRIKVSEYTSFKPIKNYDVTKAFGKLDSIMFEQVQSVFSKFVELKGFSPVYDFNMDTDRSAWIFVSKENYLSAFTKMQIYSGGLESYITAWDYAVPKDSLGRKIIDYEVDVARNLDLDYLYIGPGYNSTCIYKTRIPGFEWWNGSEWSTDKDKYIELCNRDDTIETVEDLSKIYAI